MYSISCSHGFRRAAARVFILLIVCVLGHAAMAQPLGAGSAPAQAPTPARLADAKGNRLSGIMDSTLSGKPEGDYQLRVKIEEEIYRAVAERLKKASAVYDRLIVKVRPDLEHAEIVIENPRERRGINGKNELVPIDGELKAEYAGRGRWLIKGQRNLGHINLEVDTSRVLAEESKGPHVDDPVDTELRNIVMACQRYEADNQRWPGNLEYLFAEFKPGPYLHPSSAQSILSRFDYSPPGEAANPQRHIVLYPCYTQWPGKLRVVFADGSTADWVMGEEKFREQVLSQRNGIRHGNLNAPEVQRIVGIGKAFVEKQPWSSEYHIEKPAKVIEYQYYWYVMFKRIKPALPNECLIKVDKKTLQPASIPLE